jgi:hypothetical protein
VTVEGEELSPGEEFAGESDQGAPDPVRVEPVQRQVGQASVLGVADPVLGPGPAAVPQFQIGQLSALGVGRERGDPVPIDIGQAELGSGMGSFLAGNDSHAFGPAGQVE